MWSKADFYSAVAKEPLEGLTASWQEWAKFLTTASRLYKYPFMDQMMIYAQRPDATACAEYDLWNDKMNRYVRRGSKGGASGSNIRSLIVVTMRISAHTSPF